MNEYDRDFLRSILNKLFRLPSLFQYSYLFYIYIFIFNNEIRPYKGHAGHCRQTRNT